MVNQIKSNVHLLYSFIYAFIHNSITSVFGKRFAKHLGKAFRKNSNDIHHTMPLMHGLHCMKATLWSAYQNISFTKLCHQIRFKAQKFISVKCTLFNLKCVKCAYFNAKCTKQLITYFTHFKLKCRHFKIPVPGMVILWFLSYLY